MATRAVLTIEISSVERNRLKETLDLHFSHALENDKGSSTHAKVVPRSFMPVRRSGTALLSASTAAMLPRT